MVALGGMAFVQVCMQGHGHGKHGLTCKLVQEGGKVQDLGGRQAQGDRGQGRDDKGLEHSYGAKQQGHAP